MNVAFKQPASPVRSLDSIAEALLLPTGIDGVYARTAIFEQVVDGLGALISRHRDPDTEVLRFPPVMSRRQLEKSGYLKSFPHFLGCVSCLAGDEADIGAQRRALRGGRRLDAGACGRRSRAQSRRLLSGLSAGREPRPRARRAASSSTSPATASAASRQRCSIGCNRSACANMSASARRSRSRNFRAHWMERAEGFAGQLGLNYRIDQASDPFFGRGGKLMAMSQVEQALKFELLVPVHSEEQPTACMSFNYHREHFGDDLEFAQRGRRDGAYRLRRLRHRPSGFGAVRDARHRSAAMADARAPGADDLTKGCRRRCSRHASRLASLAPR